mmetsp:Transcript_24450/g.21709  ORF Transcript_24450/g.21709 Transcript_24450/m.21709 type:complete len:108 (+) Transcript_24450:119-442(+)
MSIVLNKTGDVNFQGQVKLFQNQKLEIIRSEKNGPSRQLTMPMAHPILRYGTNTPFSGSTKVTLRKRKESQCINSLIYEDSEEFDSSKVNPESPNTRKTLNSTLQDT